VFPFGLRHGTLSKWHGKERLREECHSRAQKNAIVEHASKEKLTDWTICLHDEDKEVEKEEEERGAHPHIPVEIELEVLGETSELEVLGETMRRRTRCGGGQEASA